MSTPQAFAASGPKKAVHVKWAGKTIALGTFPAAEADEKCARAKALTRAWRSTMRPKPSRDWVMLELERLNVRVVSGRMGGRGKGEGEDEEGGAPRVEGHVPGPDRKGSLGWNPSDDFDSMMQRRSSSIGFGRSGSLGLGAVDDPSRRPLVGGGAAAAYEAARADHYGSIGGGKGTSGGDPPRNLGMGGGAGMGGMSVNPNQHYEMLKLHHMNLLNEIQETTLMMNLYQQQQLQQQQQQLQGPDSQMGPGAGMDSMYGGSGPGSFGRPSLGGMDSIGSGRASLGLGTTGGQLPNVSKQDPLAAAQQEQDMLEARLQKIKDEIAQKTTNIEGEGDSKKRKTEGDEQEDDNPEKKRAKMEEKEKAGDGGDNGEKEDDTAKEEEAKKAEV